jgi:hypothetical protein
MTTTTSCDSVINETTNSLNQFTGEVVSVAHTIDVRICEASYKTIKASCYFIQSGVGSHLIWIRAFGIGATSHLASQNYTSWFPLIVQYYHRLLAL